jgi:hypothetical protein
MAITHPVELHYIWRAPLYLPPFSVQPEAEARGCPAARLAGGTTPEASLIYPCAKYILAGVLMLDWKILAASFAALLVVSSVAFGNFGIGDFFSGILDKLNQLLGGGSPFTGLFGRAGAGTEVNVTLYPDSIYFDPSSVNVTSPAASVHNFGGRLTADLAGGVLYLEEKSSKLSVSFPLANATYTVEGLSFQKLSLSGTRFQLRSNQSDISSQGNLEIQGFAGRARISGGSVVLEGNATKITGDSWEIA